MPGTSEPLTPQVNTPINIPPPIPPASQKTLDPIIKRLLPVVGAILIIAVVGSAIIVIYQMTNKNPANFTECLSTPGHSIDPNNPNNCTTKDGKSYVQEPSPAPISNTVSPSPTIDIPTDWKEYTNTSLNFSLRYPAVWKDPVESVRGKLTRIQFNTTMTIENGIYTVSGNDLTFQQFVDKNRPPARTVIDYALDKIPGKRFLYQQGNSMAETLIAIPYGEGNSILTISYKAYPTDSDAQRVLFQVLSSFKFSSDSVIPTPLPTETALITTGNCKITGCNKEICVEADAEDTASICIFKPEYACYKDIKCEKQSDGKCGWTKTDGFNQCVDKAKSTNSKDVPQ